MGCNIRIDSRGNEVMRVLPRLHEDVNEEWIHDKTRFSYDGLKKRRLDTPMTKSGGQLRPASWNDALRTVADRLGALPGERIAAIVGDLADCESMVMLKELMSALGSPHLDCRQDGARLAPDNRAGWLFNSTIDGIERADAILLVGCNPRHEAPVLNARIRKRHRQGGLTVGRIGVPVDLTYPAEELGAGPATLQELADGGIAFAKILSDARNPLVIVGASALMRPDAAAVLALVAGLPLHRDGWNGFNVLHSAASRVGGLELGIVPGSGGRDVPGILDGVEAGEIDAVFLLGADEVDTQRLGKAFVIYQGHHGDRGAAAADVILPGAAYTEKHATYVNFEGRPQRAKLAVFPPGDAKEDWKILRALLGAMGHPSGIDTLGDVRRRIAELAPHLANIDTIMPSAWRPVGASGPGRARGLCRSGGRFLSDQRDQPGVRDHGSLQRDRRRARRPSSDRHPWLSFST